MSRWEWTKRNIIWPLVIAGFLLVALSVVIHHPPTGYDPDPCATQAANLHQQYPETAERVFYQDCKALAEASR